MDFKHVNNKKLQSKCEIIRKLRQWFGQSRIRINITDDVEYFYELNSLYLKKRSFGTRISFFNHLSNYMSEITLKYNIDKKQYQVFYDYFVHLDDTSQVTYYDATLFGVKGPTL